MHAASHHFVSGHMTAAPRLIDKVIWDDIVNCIVDSSKALFSVKTREDLAACSSKNPITMFPPQPMARGQCVRAPIVIDQNCSLQNLSRSPRFNSNCDACTEVFTGIYVFHPTVPGYPKARFPGVVVFSEIYQGGNSHRSFTVLYISGQLD